MKSTMLLTAAIFLASAPSPDSLTISELSAGFLVLKNEYGLLASELAFKPGTDPGASTHPTALPMRELN